MVKVLIVDENVTLCHQLKENLDDLFHVYYAHSCDDALTICQRASIDIVFTTLNLPSSELSGYLSKLRDQYPETRVIAVSGKTVDHIQIASIISIGSLGVDRVVSHPFAKQEINKAVHQELDSCISMV